MTDAYVYWESVARFVNPMDGRMMATIVAAEALSGRDSFCMNYLKAFRAGMLEG